MEPPDNSNHGALEFLSNDSGTDTEGKHLLPVVLEDGSQGHLSLKHYDVVITFARDGDVRVGITSGIDPKDVGAALSALGLDMQTRPFGKEPG